MIINARENVSGQLELPSLLFPSSATYLLHLSSFARHFASSLVVCLKTTKDKDTLGANIDDSTRGTG